jgi:hypothetical protein
MNKLLPHWPEAGCDIDDEILGMDAAPRFASLTRTRSLRSLPLVDAVSFPPLPLRKGFEGASRLLQLTFCALDFCIGGESTQHHQGSLYGVHSPNHQR